MFQVETLPLFDLSRVVKTPMRVARALDHQLLLTSVAAILLFLVFIVLDFHLALDAFPNEHDSTAAQGSLTNRAVGYVLNNY